MYETLLINENLSYAIFNHLKCIVFPLCPGSPFLASEDRVLGGVIVLRCCRCVEAQPSQNFQGILGKMLIISRLGRLRWQWKSRSLSLNWQVANKIDGLTKALLFSWQLPASDGLWAIYKNFKSKQTVATLVSSPSPPCLRRHHYRNLHYIFFWLAAGI